MAIKTPVSYTHLDLIENSPELKLINDIIRKNIVEAKRQNDLSSDEKYQKMFMDIMKDLPKDRRLWNYRCLLYTSL